MLFRYAGIYCMHEYLPIYHIGRIWLYAHITTVLETEWWIYVYTGFCSLFGMGNKIYTLHTHTQTLTDRPIDVFNVYKVCFKNNVWKASKSVKMFRLKLISREWKLDIYYVTTSCMCFKFRYYLCNLSNYVWSIC